MSYFKLLLKNKKTNNYIFLYNTLVNFLFKGVGILISILLVPVLLDVLGQERFGAWQTLLPIITWVSLLNFGLSNGLRNVISELIANNEHGNIGSTIGETAKVLTKIIGFVGVPILIISIVFFDPAFLFQDCTIPNDELKLSFLIFFAFFILNLLFSISSSIAYGFQKSQMVTVTTVSYQFFCLLAILVLENFIKLNLVHIAFIFGLVQTLSYIGLLLFEKFVFKFNIVFNKKSNTKRVFNLSWNFFIVQLLAMIYFSVDNILISSKFGANKTAEFSILNKIFLTIINVYSILLIQLWNSTTEAFSLKNFKWIKKIIKILVFIALIMFLFCLLVSFFSTDILDFWLKSNNLLISNYSFYLFSIYTLFHCINSIFVNIQNGTGKLYPQMVSISMAILIYLFGLFIFGFNDYNSLIIFKTIGTIAALVINVYYVKKILS